MTYGLPAARKFAKITIDHTKCTVPFLCKKCLQICPELVFDVDRDPQVEKRGEEVDPRIDGNYILGAHRYDKCTGCKLCLEVCPVNALTIEVPIQHRETFKASH